MKIYGGQTHILGRQVRAIVKAKSLKAVAVAANESLYHIRQYWCVTGNEKELAAMEGKPEGTVLCTLHRIDVNYIPVSEAEETIRNNF